LIFKTPKRRLMMVNKKAFLVLIFLLVFCSLAEGVFAEEVMVYSARNKVLTKIPFNKFFRQTGIKINVVNGNIDELLEKLGKEGGNPPADVLITVEAKQADLFQPIDSDILTKNIPTHLRDPNNHWFGLSKRARTIVYSSKRVDPSELTTYEDLAQPKWKERLCLRTSKKVYNKSLVAMMISRHGVDETEKILKGWVQNLAADPYKKDSEVIRAIIENKCDVGIVNHYYYGRILKKDPDIPVNLFWPNQGDGEGGVYVDISGAGVMKHAGNKDAAVKLLEWLSSEKAQNLFADSNMEYPVNPNVEPNAQVQAWGAFKQNTDNLSQAGKNRDTSIELMDRAAYR
jgi:iron(III) transport system substrate-binding protein